MSTASRLRHRNADGWAALRAQGLARRFGARMILRDVHLRVDHGDAVALVGANGTGKSTLLRIAAGALRPTGGTLEVCGHSLRHQADLVRANTALLAGDAFLYNDLTPRENLRFAVRMFGGDPSSRRLDDIIEFVGLEHVADVRIRNFSSGMKKRLALARVTAMDPHLLLLDEPYSSLDDDAMLLVDHVVREWTGRGRAVLMATHLLDRARRVCPRDVRLVGGVTYPAAPNSAALHKLGLAR